MRFVAVFISGVAAGYFLHTRKEKTIDQVAMSMADFLKRWEADMRNRVTTATAYIPSTI